MLKPGKRLDLQGIRGLAIISVILFHFWGDYVPNGYLGVDQFFVLSGYLMSMILQTSSDQPILTQILLFYSKRLKRILPLYYFVIVMALVALYTVFPTVSRKINRESGGNALIFMSNRPRTAEEDYFQMLSIAINIFTHTWSLSVEIQFYLLIPFIYLIGRNFSKNFQYCYYIFIGFLVHLSFETPKNDYECVPSDSDDPDLEKLIETEENTEEPNGKPDFIRIFMIFCLVLMVFSPIKLDSMVLRPLTTSFTGILIYLKTNSKILQNRVLTYFGDISYTIYLIHWPLYAYWKVTGEQIALLTYFIGSIIISIIIHETFEKWYLNQSLTTLGLLTATLLIINILLINKNVIMDYSRPPDIINSSLDRAARLNHRWNLNDYNSLFVPTCAYEVPRTPFGWCRHKNLTEKLKIMLIGNSWTANHATMFYEECGGLAGSILQGAASACEPLYPTRLSDVCKKNFTDFLDRVRMEKPDYVFMFTRFVTIGDPSTSSPDPIYQIMKSQMLKLIPHIARKMYILQAMPRPNIEFIEEIVPMLKKGVDTEVIDNLLVNQTLYQTARRRYTQLSEDCHGKCVLVDYDPIFWNSTTKNFRFYDEQGLSFFTTTTHLTPRGIEFVRPVWRGICGKLQ